jgi:hypothetical protein
MSVDLSDRITFDDSPERLKVTIPIQRNLLGYVLLLAFTLLIVVWLGGTIYGLQEIIALFRDNDDLPRRFINLLGFIIIVGWLLWVWFGYRYVWRWWQYHLATREVLFINRETLIVRRPVSILGLTDGYDMRHVSPLRYIDRHKSVGFDYGSRTILIATNLPERDATWLIVKLNDRYFPGWNDEDDEDDDE